MFEPLDPRTSPHYRGRPLGPMLSRPWLLGLERKREAKQERVDCDRLELCSPNYGQQAGSGAREQPSPLRAALTVP